MREPNKGHVSFEKYELWSFKKKTMTLLFCFITHKCIKIRHDETHTKDKTYIYVQLSHIVVRKTFLEL